MNRYNRHPFIQPVRRIKPMRSDILHTFNHGDTIDILSNKYYRTPLLGWIIMCANPDYHMEFMVPVGAKLRIPFPLEKVYGQLGMKRED